MTQNVKEKRKRASADPREVSGVTSIPFEDCIQYLKKSGFYVDEKLEFYLWLRQKGVEVTGYLAPRDVDLTVVKADVRVKMPLNGTDIAILLIVLGMGLGFMLDGVNRGVESTTRLWQALVWTGIMLMMCGFFRFGFYLKSRGHAKRVIRAFRKQFEL